jgi:uncharacterized membrane protein
MMAVITAADAKLRNAAIIVHAMFVLSLLLGPTVFIGIVMAYSQRKKAARTIYESHFDYAISTFWMSGAGGMALIGLAVAAFVFMSSEDAFSCLLVLSAAFCAWLLERMVRPVIAISWNTHVFNVFGIF